MNSLPIAFATVGAFSLFYSFRDNPAAACREKPSAAAAAGQIKECNRVLMNHISKA